MRGEHLELWIIGIQDIPALYHGAIQKNEQHSVCTMADQHEIVINACYGGFGISHEAEDAYVSRTGLDPEDLDRRRDDPVLVQIVKELGIRANHDYSKLKIVRIPSQYAGFYHIDEYDGLESVRIDYASYKIQGAKTMLRNASLTKTERITRALAVLCAELN